MIIDYLDHAVSDTFFFFSSVSVWGLVCIYCLLRVGLKISRKVYRRFFDSPEEKAMSSKLIDLSQKAAMKQTELDMMESKISTLVKTANDRALAIRNTDATIGEIQNRTANAKIELDAARKLLLTETQTIKQERDKWLAERHRWNKGKPPCHACGCTDTSLFCGECGARQKSDKVIYDDVEFSIVDDYLHSIARWGKKQEANGGIVLPWPSKEDITFSVSDIEYTWSKEDSDEYDGEWYATLEWENPILGGMKLINYVQGDNRHIITLTDTDTEYDMTSGSLEEIERADVALAVEQALTAMYNWLKSEKQKP